MLASLALVGEVIGSSARAAKSWPVDEPPCALVGGLTVDSSEPSIGDAVTVTLDVDAHCAGNDVVVVLCTTGNFNFGVVVGMRDETIEWLAATSLDDRRAALVGSVQNTGRPRLLAQLTSDRDTLLRIARNVPDDGTTDSVDVCLRLAREELSRRGDGPLPGRAVVLLGNMALTPMRASVVRQADGLKADGVEVFAAGLVNGGHERLATSPDHFFPWEPGDVQGGILAARRALEAVDRTAVRHAYDTVVVTGTVPSAFDYVPASANPPATWDAQGRTLTWTVPSPPVTSTFTYDIRARECGLWEVGIGSVARGRDLQGNEYEHLYTPAEVVVPCPTATPTALPTVPTATPTVVPSATPRPTPVPRPLYLPLALREQPCSVVRRAAVALVIDTSSSMLERTGSNRTKLEAAVGAASAFVDLLRFPEDQAAVVGFDSDVEVQELTSDSAALRGALAALAPESGTNIAAGVGAAHAELASGRRRPENFPVLVLLTDGKAHDGRQPAIDAAEAAKDDGVALFTIGLGADVDRAQLVALATRPDWYYETADAEDLAAVYRAIAVDLPCPPGTYWGRR